MSFIPGQMPYSRVPSNGTPWDGPPTAYDPHGATPATTTTATPGVEQQQHLPDKSYFSNDYSTAAPPTLTAHPSESFGYEEEADPNNKPEQLRRFYFRALVCMFVPAIYTGYFFFIWHYYVRDENGVRHSERFRRGSQQHFYAWFVLGVIALNLSRYGLAGAESAMLMHPWLRARNAMQLIMHCDKTWAGPSGWMKVMKKSLTGKFKQLPSVTWWILAVPSIIPFFAIPLSGLTFELADGFDLVKGNNATVVGANATYYDYPEFRLSTTHFNWRNAQATIMRRRSAFYIPPDAEKPKWMETFPNQWVDDESFTGFIAPQSEFPIAGRIWGLRISYSCTKFNSINDFRFLKNRNSSFPTDFNNAKQPEPITWTKRKTRRQSSKLSAPDCLRGHPTFNNTQWTTLAPANERMGLNPACKTLTTYVFNQTHDRYYNVAGFLEVAAEMVPGAEDFSSLGNPSASFNNDSSNYVEFAFWQGMMALHPESESLLERPLNKDLPDHISDMEGFYEYNGVPMKALGLGCNSDFQFGTADINGFESTFTDFEPSEPKIPVTAVHWEKAWRAIIRIVTGKVFNVKYMPSIPDNNINHNAQVRPAVEHPFFSPPRSNESYFLSGLFLSAEAKNILSSGVLDQSFQTEFLSGDRFNSAILRAFKHYALHLMAGSDAEWVSTASVSEEVKVITMGPVHPTVVMVLMCFWAGLSFLIGLTFALRRKWSDTLDGFTMFRFGTDFSHKKQKLSYRDYEKCMELMRLPGLLGDMKPNEAIGKIGIVAGPVADKRKKYV